MEASDSDQRLMHPLITYLCTFGSKICVPLVCTTIWGYKLFVSLLSGIHLICIPAFPFDLPTQSVTYKVTTMNTNTCLQSYICTQKIFIVEQRKLLHIDGDNMLNCTCTIYIVTSRCMNEKRHYLLVSLLLLQLSILLSNFYTS